MATERRVNTGVALVHEGMGECLNVCNPITGMEPYTAKRRKPMDKSCRVYGNFHSDNRAVKCGTPGLYRSPMLSVIGNALRVSEPMCKYHHSEGWEKISERDSIINIEIRYVVAQDVRMGDIG